MGVVLGFCGDWSRRDCGCIRLDLGFCPGTARIEKQKGNKEMTDQTIEQEIQAKGLTAPRITPDDVEANIFREYFFTADQGATIGIEGVTPYTSQDRIDPLHPSLSLLTFCVLVLRNGFTVTGESACASPKNFDAELGRKIARQNAISKVWPLMGYELRSRLSQS